METIQLERSMQLYLDSSLVTSMNMFLCSLGLTVSMFASVRAFGSAPKILELGGVEEERFSETDLSDLLVPDIKILRDGGVSFTINGKYRLFSIPSTITRSSNALCYNYVDSGLLCCIIKSLSETVKQSHILLNALN